jgi:hypothetical protein
METALNEKQEAEAAEELENARAFKHETEAYLDKT